MSNKFDPSAIEETYRQMWRENKTYQPSLDSAKRPYYNLMMFPYPSAEGLHVGNMYAFTGADVHGRFRRMQGFDVFEPIGLDGFGIHSENYAIKIGKHPGEQAAVSEQNFYRQLEMIGDGFAWENRLETYDPEYYHWTQWLFVQMFKNGLAYKGLAMVNWCPSCKTVLADEQVEDGRCERCKTVVERKEMGSWYFKITEYADRLLENIDNYVWNDVHGESHTGLKWPNKVTVAQRNWIGRKEGMLMSYPVVGQEDTTIECFTTRADTNFGASFIVLAPEHPLISQITSPENQAAVQDYITQAVNKTEQERQAEEGKKTGVFTGAFVQHRLTNRQLPVYVADFVLMGFGTGAVVGVPAHDQRDWEFAQLFDLPILPVISSGDQELDVQVAAGKAVFEEHGTLINSEQFSGSSSEQALNQDIKTWLVSQGFAQPQRSYHLRDWLISRQRYWGPPIPMTFCQACSDAGKGERSEMPGWYSVPEEQLPVVLPHVEQFKPEGDGTSPLDNAPSDWKYTTCPGCDGQATRETDVSDTFLDSSWYFLRYPSVGHANANSQPFPVLTEAQASGSADTHPRWFPVDAYIGGAEHAVLHLLYSRFVTMALHDWGYVEVDEPFPYLFGHGLIIKDGAKMSKSKGNVVNPDEYIQKYGADALRTYLMFLGPYDQGGDFRDSGMHSMYKWLNKVWQQIQTVQPGDSTSPALASQLNQVIQKNTSDISELKYNTCIARLMEVMNTWKEGHTMSVEDAQIFLKLLAPFAPYVSEELYQQLQGGLVEKGAAFSSIHTSEWPQADLTKIQAGDVTVAVQVNGKLRATITVDTERSTQQEVLESLAKEDAAFQRAIQGKDIVKVIFVPGKILNFVVKL